MLVVVDVAIMIVAFRALHRSRRFKRGQVEVDVKLFKSLYQP